MKTLAALFILLATLSASACAEDFIDDFSSAELEGRLAERGAWKFEGNIATCVSDPDLYQQYQNHGPILKWPRQFNDGTIEFEMKPQKCQRVVFTLNGDGHVFRVTLADETQGATAGPSKVPTRIIAWATKSSKQNKGDTIKPDGFPSLPDVDGQWTRVKLTARGDVADLTIGDFKTTIEHPAVARDKNMVMITFAHGELAVRDFRLSGTRESAARAKEPVGDHQLSYILQTPAGEPPKAGWPLLLFLHGYGECGDELIKVKKHGPPKLTTRFDQLKNCVIVSPQCPIDSWWRVNSLKALVEEVIADRGDIDRNRLYVSGLSMGGYGSWSLLSHYPDYFAAAIPICGGGDPFRLPKNHPPIKMGITNEFKPEGLKLAADLPIWTFHGTDDGSVPILETERIVKSLMESGSEVKFTRYEGAGHVEAWEKAYDDPKVWKWLFEQHRPAEKETE